MISVRPSEMRVYNLLFFRISRGWNRRLKKQRVEQAFVTSATALWLPGDQMLLLLWLSLPCCVYGKWESKQTFTSLSCCCQVCYDTHKASHSSNSYWQLNLYTSDQEANHLKMPICIDSMHDLEYKSTEFNISLWKVLMTLREHLSVLCSVHLSI